ncbi:UNVERIFIED_CONTAM: hypothetical protein Sradi_6173500 [Sesamum radiatum]|uniref:DDE Tnp4 domain-containing protein n=1 Tax=Sesamum radiatum TaxID=300843 RepID=A0AAW2K9K3_SESRA
MKIRIPDQIKHLRQITEISDVKCVNNLRMSRNAFGRLCQILETSAGLRATRHLNVAEQVAIFLSVLAHHKKNCVVKHDFTRSSRTGCLGALDGTHVEVWVSDAEKGRYRNRKGQTSINVLGIFNTKGMFTYVLSGWEGSAADGRVLCDAISRPTSLKVLTDGEYSEALVLLSGRAKSDDPFDTELPEHPNDLSAMELEFVSSIETSTAWSAWCEELATNMFGEWLRH